MHQTPGGTPLLSPACANNYFPTCSIRWSSIWERRQKQHDNVASALSTHSLGSVEINRNLVGWDGKLIWINICSEMRATKPAFLLCLHSLISGQHTGFLFSVRFPFLSMAFDFFFYDFIFCAFGLPSSRKSLGQERLLYLSLTKSKRMSANTIPSFQFWRIQNKDAKMLWM